MYIYRHIEKIIKEQSKMFGAILVTGSRQTGKTTMLKKITSPLPYITLDDPIMMQAANDEAGNFFKNTAPPVFIDEIQYAPSLFPYMKMIIDEKREKGLFYLSGSQHFHMMKNVSESLAGRIGIINLSGLSLRERYGADFHDFFVPTEKYLSERGKNLTNPGYIEIWKAIHRGAMPELVANEHISWHNYYANYVKTYIERDVRDLTQVGDELAFLRFLTVIAGMTGNILNLAAVSKDVGISAPTAERWLSILTTTDIVFLLQPFHNNIFKRAIKTPKIYFYDTGLAAFLTKWSSSEVLESGAKAGAFFETFVISEIIKSFRNAGYDPPLYYYRDRDGKEIDLLIHMDGTLYPLEIKRTSNPRKEDIRSFNTIENIPDMKRGPGGIICMYDKIISFNANDRVIPVSYI